MRLTVLFASYLPTAFAQLPCYFPNGALATDRPCNLTAAVSTCCGPTYACLSNNICVATSLTTRLPGSSTYVRGSCTDPTWKSTACPLFCLDPKYDNLAGGEGIVRCPNAELDEYFCVDGSPHNCTTGQNVFVFAGAPSYVYNPAISYSTGAVPIASFTISPSISPLASVLTSASTSASTPASMLDSTSASDAQSVTATLSPTTPSSNSSNAVPIGVGVGVPVGVIALAALGYLGFRVRRKYRSVPSSNGLPTHEASLQQERPYSEAEKGRTYGHGEPQDFEALGPRRYELEEQRPVYELPATAA